MPAHARKHFNPVLSPFARQYDQSPVRWTLWSAPAAAGEESSVGSIHSVGSAGSILSIGSAGSILSIGSAGSVLSIGSAGSLLSIGSFVSVGSLFSALSIGAVGGWLDGHRRVVSTGATALSVAALLTAVSARG